jgi:hypothetical protein
MRLIGGIHRDVSGRAGDPLRFTLMIDRGLKSGRLEEVEVDEAQILRLIASGADALELFAEERRERRLSPSTFRQESEAA